MLGAKRRDRHRPAQALGECRRRNRTHRRSRRQFRARRRRLAGNEQTGDVPVHPAPRPDALDDLLAQVAALAEVKRVREARFLRKRVVAEVHSVARPAVLDAGDLGVGGVRGNGPGALQRRHDPVAPRCGSEDAVAGAAGIRRRQHDRVVPRRVGAGPRRNRRADRVERVARLRPFEAEHGVLIGGVGKLHIVGDDELVEVPVERRSRRCLGVEQNAALETQHVGVRQDAPLRVEEERVATLARLQLLDVIGGHGVQESRAVFARQREDSPFERQDGRALAECFVARHCSERSQAPIAAMASPLAATPVIQRVRLPASTPCLPSSSETANTCSASSILMPNAMW